jgi:uncharacterized protein YciI
VPRIINLNKTAVKNLLCFMFLLLISTACTSGTGQEQKPVPETGEVNFDEQLAEKLGADQYGMRTYVMALLKAGPDRSHDEETAAEIQRGHMAHINNMAASGALILAGPYIEGGELRGIFLFDTDSLEEAEALTAQDPAVQAGRLEMELIRWYGSAALMEVPAIHEKISRNSP